MKRTWIGVGLLVGFFVLAMFLMADAAVAQTPPPSPNAGAFDTLSPGNQKIADALFDAQQTSAAPGAPQLLSRDDIAAMKQSGKGWGVIFKDMKQQGLVTEKNLGKVVSGASRSASASSNGTLITSGTGRTRVEGGSASAQAGARAGVGGRGDDGAGGSVGSEHGNAYGRSGDGAGGSGRGGGAGAHGGGRGK
jgi:hypothetical protein